MIGAVSAEYRHAVRVERDIELLASDSPRTAGPLDTGSAKLNSKKAVITFIESQSDHGTLATILRTFFLRPSALLNAANVGAIEQQCLDAFMNSFGTYPNRVGPR